MVYHRQSPWEATSIRMRGNWEQAEPLVAPEQFQEHHQQAQSATTTTTTTSAMIVDASSEHQRRDATAVGRNDHHHPLSSSSPPTTPAWSSITDRIVVKQDPHEERNNDSGISPGHYTSDSASPDSRRSSTANCSLSPGSATSRDSHNMQSNDYDYSPYKHCDSLLDYARVDNHNRPASTTDELLQHDTMDHTITSDDVSSSNMKLGHEDSEAIEVSPDPLQCPLCTFSSQSRLRFTEHLASHCNTGKADVAEFTKSVMDQLTNGGSVGSPEELSRASPTQNERNSEHEFEEADEPGLRVPRVNSQGKVKTFRCKQCNFVAITKLDFWEHSRMHIKAEKLLTCPKCPFVTEYKHHLEYHLRNHFGSKPYKCDKCSYSCVNKSMLNSHLKSHSNVYQFRCADCSYATKYCHSLKLHLRKYEHKPAMVLNADGSPNPLPIIDVYGTRRGPKTKPKKEPENQDPPSPMSNGLISNAMPSVVPPQVLPLGHQFQFNGLNGMGDIGKINGFNGFNGTGPVNGMGLPPTPSLLGFPYNQIFGSFPLPNPFSIQSSDSEINESQLERIKANFIEYAKKLNGCEVNTAEDYSQPMYNDVSVKTEVMEDTKPYNRFVQNEPMPLSSKPDAQIESNEYKNTPLDLSKSEPTNNNNNNNNNHLEPRFVPTVSTNSPKTGSGTSRRKGRAIKLDRRVIENDSEDENVSDERIQHNDRFEVLPPSVSPGSTGSKDSKDLKDFKDSSPCSASISNEFTCQYCDISFGNEVMHSVHMGYHGYQNPYTCNMCGIQSSDKVSFFLHIARSKH